MTRAKLAFHITDPDTLRPVVFRPGDKVPGKIAALVGDHVLDKSKKASKDADEDDAPADDTPPEPTVKVDEEPVDELADLDALEDDEPAYDPSEHDEKAVLKHLETLDGDEFDAVIEAERQGKNRKTIVGE